MPSRSRVGRGGLVGSRCGCSRLRRRYDLPVRRSVRVREVRRVGEHLVVQTDVGSCSARYVISATGTGECPYVPDIPGRAEFAGRQLHTMHYTSPEDFRGQRVVIVGGGDSAAQILAEASPVAEATFARLTERGGHAVAE
ncbi:NAD(P)-binding domain-containing protein [Micromonospora coxensis]|uniref:NAD(P)-binding domain-containing protein n=1 Tax=Micromonospora coxensis TaxID=356852 RepID=UPI00344AB79D